MIIVWRREHATQNKPGAQGHKGGGPKISGQAGTEYDCENGEVQWPGKRDRLIGLECNVCSREPMTRSESGG